MVEWAAAEAAAVIPRLLVIVGQSGQVINVHREMVRNPASGAILSYKFDVM